MGSGSQLQDQFQTQLSDFLAKLESEKADDGQKAKQNQATAAATKAANIESPEEDASA